MTTYEKIKELCENAGFSISSLSQKIPGLSVNKASITGWKKGSKPRPDKIKAIADFFNVPVSYFDEAEGNAASINVNTSSPLTPHEQALLSAYRSAHPATQDAVCRVLGIEPPPPAEIKLRERSRCASR